MEIYSDQDVSLPKSIFESPHEGTFLKKRLLVTYDEPIAEFDTEEVKESAPLEEDEDEWIPGISSIELVGKFPIPIIRGPFQEQRAKIVSMVDS